MKAKISVVIPTHNVEQYIRKSLESVINQTYKNLEIIVVDDVSTDRTKSIIREYIKTDERILFIEKSSNEGVSFARNEALKFATGEYLLFVDSDDWIDEETCESALKVALQSGADVVMWSYVRELGKESRKKKIFEEDIIFGKKDVKEKLYRRMIGLSEKELSQPENADALCTVWGKLYRREIIEKNNIRFFDIREIGTYEDGLFNLEFFYHANKAIFINKYFYHYRRNTSTSLTTVYNPCLGEQWKKLFALIRQNMKKNNLDKEFYKALSNRIVLSLIPLGINEMERKEGRLAIIKGIHAIISTEEYRKAIIEFEKKYLPLHWKLFFWFAKMKCALGIYILLIVIQKIRGR